MRTHNGPVRKIVRLAESGVKFPIFPSVKCMSLFPLESGKKAILEESSAVMSEFDRL